MCEVASGRASQQFQNVGENIQKWFRLAASKTNVNEYADGSNQYSVDDKVCFRLPRRPNAEQERHHKRSSHGYIHAGHLSKHDSGWNEHSEQCKLGEETSGQNA